MPDGTGRAYPLIAHGSTWGRPPKLGQYVADNETEKK